MRAYQLTPWRSSAGFGLLDSMLLMVIIGGAVVAFATLLNAPQPTRKVAQNHSVLSYIDTQLRGFALVHQRLACVDADNDGFEDCDSPQSKGGLPYRTLGLEREIANIDTLPVRYLVYRSAQSDLASVSDIFPGYGTEDGEMSFAAPDRFFLTYIVAQFLIKGADAPQPMRTYLNGFDFCAALQAAENEAPNTAAAHITGPSGPENVAYGIALDGDQLSPLNASANPSLESPFRPQDSGYNGLTRVRSLPALYADLGCEANLVALQAMIDSTAVAGEADGGKDAVIRGARLLLAQNTLALMRGANRVKDGLKLLRTSTKQVAVATITLAVDTISCAAGEFTACVRVPKDKIQLALAKVGLGKNAANLAIDGTNELRLAALEGRAAAMSSQAKDFIDEGESRTQPDVVLQDMDAKGVARGVR